MVRYEIINKNEIPKDLPSGAYQTQIVDAYLDKDGCVIKFKFINVLNNPNNPSLIILIKS